jgi:solute carrier family 25 oxoglutarate transporter 11
MTSQPTEKSSKDRFLDAIQPFWIGGLSGMIATCVIQPIDMVKVIIQLKSEKGQKATPAAAIADVMASDGIRGFYRG